MEVRHYPGLPHPSQQPAREASVRRRHGTGTGTGTSSRAGRGSATQTEERLRFGSLPVPDARRSVGCLGWGGGLGIAGFLAGCPHASARLFVPSGTDAGAIADSQAG